MKLRVIYRSTGLENPKSRPPYYSKSLALQSFLGAAARCDRPVELIYLTDGPIPRDRLGPMEDTGEVVRQSGLGMVGSYQEALNQVETREWPDDDVVYLVEDDYLHTPVALASLMAAVESVPHASYFSLYVHKSIDWRRTQGFQVGDTAWHTVDSTTSTIAARVGVLRKDMLIHRLAYRADGAWDRDACLACAGVRPYRWAPLIGDLVGSEPGVRPPPLRRLKRGTAQTLLNGFAVVRSFARHLLIAPYPSLATHMTEPYIAPGVDWEAVAATVAPEP